MSLWCRCTRLSGRGSNGSPQPSSPDVFNYPILWTTSGSYLIGEVRHLFHHLWFPTLCVDCCVCVVAHARYSHVILGFSRCGQLLLSYLSELDVTATQSNYTLHWWRFLGNCPLRHVSSEGETAQVPLESRHNLRSPCLAMIHPVRVHS